MMYLFQIAAKEAEGLSVISMIIKGGWVMIPLFVLSVIAIYIFIERYLTIKNANKIPRAFMSDIKDYVSSGNLPAALKLCDSNDSAISRMISKGVQRLGQPIKTISDAIENVGRLELYKLEKNLPMLATISGVAPMIGFLGTVLGMIKAFYQLANAGSEVDAGLLAGGIYQALITTAAGLMVGIISYIAYNYLTASVEKVVGKMEATSIDFLDLLNEPA